MKELTKIDSDKIVAVDQAEIAKKLQFSFRQILKRGHKVWQINQETLEVVEADVKSTFVLSQKKSDGKFPILLEHFAEDAWYKKNYDSYSREEIILKEGFVFVPSLNAKNALKNYEKSLARIKHMIGK